MPDDELDELLALLLVDELLLLLILVDGVALLPPPPPPQAEIVTANATARQHRRVSHTGRLPLREFSI